MTEENCCNPATATIANTQLVVFGKIPGLAPCKTRLLLNSPLNEKQVQDLALAFLEDTLIAALNSRAETIHFISDPETSLEQFAEIVSSRQLKTQLCDPRLKISAQISAAFTERLEHALATAARLEGLTKTLPVVVIGSDAPLISAEIINRALEAVACGQAALGPTADGGVYLIGFPSISATDYLLPSEAFNQPEATELQYLAESFSRKSIRFRLLEAQFDVDLAEDLISVIALLKAQTASQSLDTSGEVPRGQTALASFSAITGSSTLAMIEQLGIKVSRQTENNRALVLTVGLQ